MLGRRVESPFIVGARITYCDFASTNLKAQPSVGYAVDNTRNGSTMQ